MKPYQGLMVAITLCIATCFHLVWNPTVSNAGNWPQWRGPQANGVSDEQDPPTTWSRTENVLWRLPLPGPVAFGRGLQIEVTLDGQDFEGVGAFLLGAVLDRFFARYVSINSFTETIVSTLDRGEIVRWPARIGQRHRL